MSKAAGKTVLWVPGPWNDEPVAVAAVAETSGGRFSVSDGELFDSESGRSAEFAVLEREPQLAEWMRLGSGKALDESVLSAISQHGSVCSLTLADRGSTLVEDLAAFSGALRGAGGFAIRLARCGLAHPWDRWNQFLSEQGPAGLYKALVVQVPDDERGWLSSFGMNQFDLPDAAFNGDDYTQPDASWTVFAFNAYLREENPKLEGGDTFSFDDDAPIVALSHAPDDRYVETDPFFNPRGIWILTPVD